ncbi:MAG TPA: ion channel, partial [Kofleriaceae bacterium]|nr:ion channel [Kofleriaceae bacterium]
MAPPPPPTPIDPHSMVVRIGEPHGILFDFYARLLRARWHRLIALFAGFYGLANALFASLYLLAGDAIQNAEPGSFLDAFSFSVQTMATIGYGAMSPRGLAGNALVLVESFTGLLSLALATGIVFAKFARPRPGFLFSHRAVVGARNGVPCLMLRVANSRGADIADASIRVTALMSETTAEGEALRRFRDLALERDRTPLLLMSWLVIHPIDERSPLHGKPPAEWQDIQIYAS